MNIHLFPIGGDALRAIARGSRIAGIAGLVALGATGISAQTWSDDDVASDPYGIERDRDVYDRRSDNPVQGYVDHEGFGARLGVGLTASPTNFLVDLAVPYSMGAGTSLGPRVQIGISEDRTLVAPTIAFEYAHDLSGQFDGALGRLRPLLHGGLGFAWLQEDDRRGPNDEAGFLVDIGTGIEYPLSDRFAIASVFDFNILPKETLGETFFFNWQIVQMRIKF